jgi:tripartite-type tricarboxylate transporter receptor subunit TctC
MSMNVSRFLGLFVTAFLAVSTSGAQAELAASCKETLSAKRISLVVQTGPGGGFDMVARLVAPKLAETIGVSDVQVKNMPSGGGLLAVKHVLENSERDIAIGYFTLTDYVEQTNDVNREDLIPIAGIVDQEAVWVGRSDFDLNPQTLEGLSMPLWRETSRIIAYYYFTALALGTQPKLVFGYTDSGDLHNAMLRGELDINPLAADTAKKTIKSGGAKVILTFADKPSLNFPDAPFLLGPDGLVAKFSAGESPETIERRMKLATVAAEFSPSKRGAFVYSKMKLELRACLEQAFAVTLADQKLLDDAKAAKFELSPSSAPEVQAYAVAMQARTKELAAEFDAARQEIAKLR